MAIAADGRAGGSIVAQREKGQVFGVDAEQRDIVGLIGREDFDDREESSIGSQHAHRFAGRARGHVVIGRDDAVGGNGEAARRSVVPLGALIAFVGGTDEHGGLGATAIDFCAFEWCSCERFGRESNGIGMRAFALFEPVFAAEGAITFFCQGRSRGFKLLEYLKIIDGTIDV